VDLKNFLASWSLRSDMVGRSDRKMALAYGISCAISGVNYTYYLASELVSVQRRILQFDKLLLLFEYYVEIQFQKSWELIKERICCRAFCL